MIHNVLVLVDLFCCKICIDPKVSIECPMDTFRCGNNRCIQYSKVCDGNNDCNDNKTLSKSSDETIGCQGIFIRSEEKYQNIIIQIISYVFVFFCFILQRDTGHEEKNWRHYRKSEQREIVGQGLWNIGFWQKS